MSELSDKPKNGNKARESKHPGLKSKFNLLQDIPLSIDPLLTIDELCDLLKVAVREELLVLIKQIEKYGGFRTDRTADQTPGFKPYLTIKEAADFARLAPPTIRLYIRKRSLRAHKVGRRVIIKREELIAFLEQRQTMGAGI